MKTYLTICLLCCCHLATSQSAYDQTKDLIKYSSLLERPDLDTLMDIYVEKLSFGVAQKSDIESVQQFTKTPFEYEMGGFGLPIYQLGDLQEIIDENRSRKQSFLDQINPSFAANCFTLLGLDQDSFLYDDKIILDQELVNCYNEEVALLDEDLPLFYTQPNTVAGATVESYDGQPSVLTPMIPSPLSLTTRIIDGTSQYLVDRVKEELLLAFFDQFLVKIDSSTELKALLPDTYFLLKTNDLFHVPSMGEVWMTAFKNDLQTIPAHFQEMVWTHPDYAAIKNNDAVQLFGITALALQYINEESRPLETLDRIYDENKYADSDIMRTIGLVGLLRRNLRIGNEYVEPVSREDFLSLMREKEEASTYFSALLYHQDQDLFKKTNVNLNQTNYSLAQLLQTETPLFIDKVAQLYSAVDRVQNLNSLPETSGFVIEQDSVSINDRRIINYIDAMLEFVDFSMQLAYFANEDAYFQSTYYNKIRPISDNTLVLFDAALKEDYGQLILSSMYVLGSLVEERIQYLEKKKMLPNAGNLSGESLRKKRKRIDREIQTLETVVKDFMFYAGFMIDVMDAQSSSAIKGVIEKYATPVGSYRSNRERQASVSLSAYPGVYSGFERIASEQKWVGVTGVTAPIGFAVNFGDRYIGRKRKSHSVGLFLPLIDIGAAFSYRWNVETETKGFPEDIRLHQIFSPGVYAVWGVANMPLAFKLGTQYTPKLRTITTAANGFQDNAWRLSISATVDIPIFYLFRSKQ